MRAMIFAAGLGTRLQSETAGKPKALVEISGRTLLEHAIGYLKKFGITEMVINVHHFADQIIDFLHANRNFGINIQISDERDFLLDTGGGLKKAGALFSGNGPIVLYNVDIFTNLDLYHLFSFHIRQKALATLVVRKRETSRYLLFDRNYQLTGWKNVKTNEIKICRPELVNESEAFAFSGIQIVNPDIFELIVEEGKFSIIDLYLRLAQSHVIKAFVDDSQMWLDLGKKEQLPDAERLINNFKDTSND